MHSNIPDVPAGRRVAGLSGAEPCSTPGSSGPPRPGRPAHSSVVAADTGISDARLKDLFWGTTASGADAASDICAHLCQLRRTLQADHMDARGIDCRFDIEPGRLPKPVCESLGLAIRALILDAAEHAPAGLGDKTIAVTLRRRSAIWACSVAHSGSSASRAAGPRSWLAIAEAHAAALQADFRTTSSNRGTITAILFAADRSSIDAAAVH